MLVGLYAICVCNWNWKSTQDHFPIEHWSQRSHHCSAPVVEYSAHDWRAATGYSSYLARVGPMASTTPGWSTSLLPTKVPRYPVALLNMPPCQCHHGYCRYLDVDFILIRYICLRQYLIGEWIKNAEKSKFPTLTIESKYCKLSFPKRCTHCYV